MSKSRHKLSFIHIQTSSELTHFLRWMTAMVAGILLFFSLLPASTATPVDNLLLDAMNPVRQVLFSADESKVITLGAVYMRMWSTDSGKQLWRFARSNQTTRLTGARLSANGNSIYVWAIGSPYSEVWQLDTKTGRKLHHVSVSFEIHWLTQIQQRLLVGGVDPSAPYGSRLRQMVIDAETFKHGEVFATQTPYAEFSPDGRYLLALGNTMQGKSDELAELSSGQKIQLAVPFTSMGQSSVVGSSWQAAPHFSSDGLLLAGLDSNNNLIVVECATDKVQLTIPDMDSEYSRFAFFPDNKSILISSRNRKIRRVELASGKLIRQYAAHSDEVRGISIAPSGQYFVSGAEDGTARIWLSAGQRNLLAEKHENPLPPVRVEPASGHVDSIRELALSPDGRLLLSVSSDHQGIIWDLDRQRPVRHLVGETDEINAAAFSPDGLLVLTGSGEGAARLREVTSGQEIWRFEGPGGYKVSSVSFSPDGSLAMIVVGKYIWIWDVKRGEEKHRLEGPDGWALDAAFSPDGNHIISLHDDGSLRLWRTKDGQLLKHKSDFKGGLGLSVSQSGRQFLLTTKTRLILLDESLNMLNSITGKFEGACFTVDGKGVIAKTDEGLEWLDLQNGKRLRQFRDSDYASYPLVTPDGQSIIAAISEEIQIWSLNNTNKEKQVFGKNESTGVKQVTVSEDGKSLMICFGNVCRLWGLNTGQEQLRLVHYDSRNQTTLAGKAGGLPSTDPSHVLTIDSDGVGSVKIHTWNRISGEYIHSMKMNMPTSGIGLADTKLALSSDGSKVAIAQEKLVEVWDIAKQSRLFNLSGIKYPVSSLVFSPDGSSILTASQVPALGGTASDYEKGIPIRLWDANNGKPMRKLGSYVGGVDQALFSPDSKQILTISGGGWITVYDRESGKELDGFKPFQASVIQSAVISQDGNSLLLGTAYKGAALIDLQNKRLRYRFTENVLGVNSVTFSVDNKYAITGGSDNTIVFYDLSSGNWIARLMSTGAFEEGDWVVVTPDGRYDSSSPGTVPELSYVVSDDPLTPLPVEIFMKEYYEPRLLGRILAGEKMPKLPILSQLNRVQPNVQIVSIDPMDSNHVSVTVEVTEGQTASKANLNSGVFDLRLFRDGQLIGYSPQKSGPVTLKVGKARLTFSGIKLPTDHLQSRNYRVTFSAYAFNRDGIKSATVSQQYELNAAMDTRTPRAYVISIGVNSYQNSTWNLEYAANDAASILGIISAKLKQSSLYTNAEIISIPLISTQGNEISASKAKIKAVFDLLVGKKVTPTLIASIPNADKIKQANPEDFLLISYSGHGYADKNREFYVFPYDIGMGSRRSIAPKVLNHLISSEELSLWLRDVDAGEMTMIIDACNSAASVEGKSFKPGPMGSRGLGQLAYDKGMRILTASQAESVALESAKIRHGVLTYSLVEEGIEQKRADYLPKDDKIMLGEWLKYGVKRVPALNQEIASGSLTTSGRGAIALNEGKFKERLSPYAQQPSLFDFNKHRSDTILFRLQ